MTQAPKTKKIFDGRYEILSIVGRGARSVVYHARHTISPSQEVALKVLLESKKGKTSSGERLRREALAMVSSRSKYVVRLDDFHSVGSLCYLSMEFAPQSDLRVYCRKMGNKLHPSQAERFLRQTAEALSFVHKAGIIHRDVKPDNILVMNEKEIRLTDFGVALLPGEECSLAELQSGVGTMNYMGPEVLEGKKMDERSDIYSLGVVYYEVISGINPFENAPLAQQMERRRDNNIPPLKSIVPDVPDYLAAVIARAMSFEPQNRYASARDVVQALIAGRSAAFATAQSKGSHKRHRAKPMRHVEGAEKSTAALEAESAPEPQTAPPEKETQEAEIAAPKKEPIRTVEQLSAEQTVFIQHEEAERIREAALPAEALKPAKPYGRLKAAAFLLSILFLLSLLSPGIRQRLSAVSVKYFKLNLGQSISRLTSFQPEPLIPPFVEQSFDFPALPSGLYNGSITNFVPGKTLPLAFISFQERDELAVIIGQEGWTPAMVNPRRLVPPGSAVAKPLRVASNGFIIEFTGQNIEGELFGYFTNIVSGTQGEWRAQPVK